MIVDINGMSVEVDTLNVKISKPLFEKGDVIDIRPSKNGAPNRILIVGIVLVVLPGISQWNYEVELESDHTRRIFNADYILRYRVPVNKPVYSLDVIKLRYENGWRFYGNHNLESYQLITDRLVASDVIANVRVCEAYGPSGNLLSDNTVSVWIKYAKPIEKGTNKEPGKIDLILK